MQYIPSVTWVHIKEDAGHNNDLFLDRLFSENHAACERGRERLQVNPNVEGAVRRVGDGQSHHLESLQDVASFHSEMAL